MGSNLALWRPEERLCTTEWAVTLITRVVWFGIWVWDWWAVSLIPKPFGLRSGYEAGELLASVVHWQSVFSLQKRNWLWSSQCGYQCTDHQSVSLCRMQWVKLDKEKDYIHTSWTILSISSVVTPGLMARADSSRTSRASYIRTTVKEKQL